MSTRTQNKGFRSNEQNVDLYFSSNGDFRLGVGGDIERTIGYPHQALIQTVTKRLSSSAGDWPAQQSIGANLGDFAPTFRLKISAVYFRIGVKCRRF